MQRLNREKRKTFHIRNKTSHHNLADVYVQVKLLASYKFVGAIFFGLPDFLVFDIILWIFLSKWMDKNCILYIVADVNVLLRGTK